MTMSLLDMLKRLKSDPTIVIDLYPKLLMSTFYILVKPGTERELDSVEFLIYDTTDKIKELPIFSTESFILKNISNYATKTQFGGEPLWTKLLDIVETNQIVVALDPGQSHGIRLTKEIILGMLSNYKS